MRKIFYGCLSHSTYTYVKLNKMFCIFTPGLAKPLLCQTPLGPDLGIRTISTAGNVSGCGAVAVVWRKTWAKVSRHGIGIIFKMKLRTTHRRRVMISIVLLSVVLAISSVLGERTRCGGGEECVHRVLRASESDSEAPQHSYRLPKSVLPDKYFLTIVPILEAGLEDSLGEQWYSPGHLVIDVDAIKATKTVTLHAKNITIHNITITRRANDALVPVRNVSLGRRHSFLHIHLGQALVAGESYKINISFTSYVSEVLNGLFRSSYVNPDNGRKEWFAATHMEALHARQMFPCFDEPSYKASIQAKVGRRDDYVALFNAESIANETMQGVPSWVWETFAPTVPMSTYLTALVVSKFQYTEAPGILLPDVRVRTYAPPHYVQQGAAEYPSEVAEKILYTYGEYFKEKFPMNKFDSVAVPSFMYGAMENYGLSIFRETLLLNWNESSTEAQRYIVTMVIAHELGHQWFGNQVTMKWWTDLWLSEGITKFTEYVGMNASIPEFQPWDMFLIESLQAGLRLDSDPKTSHSLKIDEDAWSLKNEMEWFDDIAYKKGGSLIRMMQGFLSEPVMRKGLGRYLSRLKFKAAVQDDLFSDCGKEGELAHKLPENTTLKEIMSSWTLQSGFPLLRVSRKGTNEILVTQEKYFSSRQNGSGGKSFMWYIPISIATKKQPSFDPDPEFWMRSNESSVRINLPANSWIILNAGTTGFYRVIYDDELSRRITDQLMEFPWKIDRLARSQLMDDYFNAAWNRYIPIRQALNVTLYMREHAETEHVVWTSLLSMLKVAFKLFKASEQEFAPFKAYMLPRLEKSIQTIGGYSAVNKDTKGIHVLRHAQLLDWVCNLDSRECIQHSMEQVKLWKKTGELLIPRDFQSVLFSTAVAHDPAGDLFDFIKEKYMNSSAEKDSKLKERLLTGLASTRNPDKIKSLLESITQFDSFVDTSDLASLLQNVASNSAATEVILKYFVNNLPVIVNHFGGVSPIVLTANAMAPHMKSLNGLFLIEQLVEGNEHLLKSPLSSAIARIRANIMWYDDFGEDMLDFFKLNTVQ